MFIFIFTLLSEFSKEKERVESRNKFIKERREEEEREKRIASGEAWIDEGERLRLEEEAKKRMSNCQSSVNKTCTLIPKSFGG